MSRTPWNNQQELGKVAHSVNGAVAIAIASPTRILLVLDPSKRDPKLKLPAGGIEDGESVIDAAVREAYEESGGGLEGKGVMLDPSRVRLIQKEWDGIDGYYPYLCYAEVTESEFDEHGDFAGENGTKIEVHEVLRVNVAKLGDRLVTKHHALLQILDVTIGGF